MADWDFTYNGLTFGGSTQYGILQVQGLEPPEAKTDIRQKVATDGAFVFASYYAERRVIIDGDIVPTSGGAAALEVLVNAWRVAFDNQTAEQPLEYKLPGQNTRRIWCRPVRRVCTVDLAYGLGYARWTIEFVASEAAIYNSSDVKQYDG